MCPSTYHGLCQTLSPAAAIDLPALHNKLWPTSEPSCPSTTRSVNRCFGLGVDRLSWRFRNAMFVKWLRWRCWVMPSTHSPPFPTWQLYVSLSDFSEVYPCNSWPRAERQMARSQRSSTAHRMGTMTLAHRPLPTTPKTDPKGGSRQSSYVSVLLMTDGSNRRMQSITVWSPRA